MFLWEANGPAGLAGGRAWVIREVAMNTDEAKLTGPLLTTNYAAWFLTGTLQGFLPWSSEFFLPI